MTHSPDHNDKAPASGQRLARRFDKSVTLIGMMGVGKTTIGRRLAPKLNLPFKDADAEIVSAAGMPIDDLFKLHGEESFRRGEAQVIERLLSGPPIVLATGGGAILNPDTRRRIADKSISIWIKADITVIAKRAMRRPTRPLLKNGDPAEILSKLIEARRPYYAEADISIDSRPGPHNNTVEAILHALHAYHPKLCEEDAQ